MRFLAVRLMLITELWTAIENGCAAGKWFACGWSLQGCTSCSSGTCGSCRRLWMAGDVRTLGRNPCGGHKSSFCRHSWANTA